MVFTVFCICCPLLSIMFFWFICLLHICLVLVLFPSLGLLWIKTCYEHLSTILYVQRSFHFSWEWNCWVRFKYMLKFLNCFSKCTICHSHRMYEHSSCSTAVAALGIVTPFLAISVSVYGISVILIDVFLMTADIEHLCMCLSRMVFLSLWFVYSNLLSLLKQRLPTGSALNDQFKCWFHLPPHSKREKSPLKKKSLPFLNCRVF